MSGLFADIQRLMESMQRRPRPELHCGVAVWDALLEQRPADTGGAGFDSTFGGMPLNGIPVHVDQAMSAGRWELREEGGVTRSGDITPEPGAFYVPGLGFVKINAPQELER